MKLGKTIERELIDAIDSSDPEIRYRAKMILRRIEDSDDDLTLAVLRVIKRDRLPGGVDVLLRIIPRCKGEYLRSAVAEALSASARVEDAGCLKAAIKSGPGEVRAAAIIALESAVGSQAIELLRRYAGDETDLLVRLSAIQGLSNHSPRECLNLLADLLESDDVMVRIRSAVTLRRLTGKRFGFVGGYDTPEFRENAVQRWRNWIHEHGTTVDVRLPVGD